MVDKRYTASDQLNSYYFVQPPNERSSSNPRGFHIDGMMMPKRDIDDASTGGDSWKMLRGEDVAWAYEASLERRYAAHQFDGLFVNRQQHVDEPYPTSRPIYRINDGTIRGWDWQYLIGDIEGSSPVGLAEVWSNSFLNISATSELQDYYYTWPDGNEIGYEVQTGPSQYDFSWNWPVWAMGGFTPYMSTKTLMKSSAANFATGKPLSAECIRDVYRDIQKLNFYICKCPTVDYSQDTTNGYNQVIHNTSWRLASHGEQSLDPIPQPGLGKTVLYESSQWFDEDPVAWRWAKYEINGGTYRIPYCGKYGRGQGYTSPLYGNEAAVYGAFYIAWKNAESSWENRSRVVFAKLNYTKRTDIGADNISWSDVIAKAKAIRDHYQATISQPTGVDEAPYCEVELVDLFLVGRLSSRTDMTTLEWH